ncbi:flavin-dependent oxidoreductase [Nonomuraea phyllanthi]|uniref:Flavin-dependent oxidoreductase n=1 Tax=Nonomuraea phyllanthi TaxID=2219224 RepID=A0A5C4W3M5_9ACTN|nr:flavin-dependent oxidoreductase [Nonomuraea phyllanthi]KAB8191514.1 flavin-dependent oxidoreductase [Nonomuraea phyllanthi]QFY13159.1 flavin-dependent oxidoreductase [Nonomuraea phyllanthi]
MPRRSPDPASPSTEILIVGAGIAGLVLALELHDAGIDCRVHEAVPEVGAVGVGINLLPHASRVLHRLGLGEQLGQVAVVTAESVFFNRFGQLIYREPAGRKAGYDHPQYSVHRGDLHAVLLAAVRERLGHDAVLLGHRCVRADQDEHGVTAHFTGPDGGDLPSVRARALVACDGIHSALRRQLHPDEGEPRYSGINMWRGVTKGRPFLSGASMVRAGWIDRGKLVAYPIRNLPDGDQLLNWVVEIQTPRHLQRDWNRRGRLEDFIGAFEDWHFDWLDVPAMMRGSQTVLEYPMVDQDPLDHWSVGRITLLGDAAHPMVPRGSNGAGQAILDARALRRHLSTAPDPVSALRAYEAERLPATAQVVLANRSMPPDVIIREVSQRTGDRPFDSIDDVIKVEELAEISQRYKEIAGFSTEALRTDR